MIIKASFFQPSTSEILTQNGDHEAVKYFGKINVQNVHEDRSLMILNVISFERLFSLLSLLMLFKI